jgi:hypothetical protein
MSDIILHSTSLKDLQAIIGEILEEKLRQFKPEHQMQPVNEYLTRRSVCDRLKISLATLHTYTKDGTLKGYKIGGRVLYLLAEVEQSIQAIQTNKYKHWRS